MTINTTSTDSNTATLFHPEQNNEYVTDLPGIDPTLEAKVNAGTATDSEIDEFSNQLQALRAAVSGNRVMHAEVTLEESDPIPTDPSLATQTASLHTADSNAIEKQQQIQYARENLVTAEKVKVTSKPKSKYKDKQNKQRPNQSNYQPENPADLTRIKEWRGTNVNAIFNKQRAALLGTGTATSNDILKTYITPPAVYVPAPQPEQFKLNPADDGVTHINVSPTAATQLGKVLDINAKSPFKYSEEYGSFDSIGGFWTYVRMDDSGYDREKCRTLSGDRARHIGRKVAQREFVDKFKTIIGEATWAKVLCNDQLSEALMHNELPITNYYVDANTGELGYPMAGRWYIPIIEKIKDCLIKNADILKDNPDAEACDLVVPDFSFLEEDERPNNRGYKPRNNY